MAVSCSLLLEGPISLASLTARITIKGGDPPETGRICENRFCSLYHHTVKCVINLKGMRIYVPRFTMLFSKLK